jgi:hypothetical protein
LALIFFGRLNYFFGIKNSQPIQNKDVKLCNDIKNKPENEHATSWMKAKVDLCTANSIANLIVPRKRRFYKQAAGYFKSTVVR